LLSIAIGNKNHQPMNCLPVPDAKFRLLRSSTYFP